MPKPCVLASLVMTSSKSWRCCSPTNAMPAKPNWTHFTAHAISTCSIPISCRLTVVTVFATNWDVIPLTLMPSGDTSRVATLVTVPSACFNAQGTLMLTRSISNIDTKYATKRLSPGVSSRAITIAELIEGWLSSCVSISSSSTR